MPLFGRKEGKNVDYKARLEHKLYLARENPEPIFDLSDCALKNVPSGVFSLCKVFRKEALFLQENQLTSLAGGGRVEDLSLLQTLDLHSNNLQKLPDEVGCLRNLRELNVSANKLTHLPEHTGELVKLRSLNVSGNSLKRLPDALGQLQQLRHLDVRLNKQLKSLPKSLCNAICLKDILLDPENFVYPPKDITIQGTQAIMQFLCKENGLEYILPIEDADVESDALMINDSFSQYEEKDNEFQAKILHLETLKAQRQQERLALERELVEQQQRELELQSAVRCTKEKLLEDIVQQQQQLGEDILRAQQDREEERQRLISHIQQVEAAADSVVSQLLALSSLRDSSQLQALVEREANEEQRLLASCHEEYQTLRRRDVLGAMETLLEEEALRQEKIREYERGREECTRSLLNQEMETERQLSEVMRQSDVERDGLAARLLQDEELQQAAVGALLERSDARSWGLVQHVRLVQEQLAALTAMEMKRRELRLSEQMDELGAKRAALSELLVLLLNERTSRRQQLFETLRALERERCSEGEPGSTQGVSDFWLRQYQRLLDARGGGGRALAEMERSLDPVLAQHLLQAGALHCLPLLAPWLLQPHDMLQDALSSLTDRDLAKAGVTMSEMREAILKAIELYLEERRQRALKFPPEDREGIRGTTPSAPTPSEASSVMGSVAASECVVCMDNECEMIFIPCGHLCCCCKCADALSDCPMCRTKVDQKIRVLLP